MRNIAFAAFCAALPTIAAAEVTVSEPWARASILANRPGAAYLTLQSDVADRLVAIETPVAATVMLHGSATDANGVSRMIHIEALDIAPGASLTLAPGGMHLMLMGLADKLDEGSSFPLTLTFEIAGDITVEVQVLGIASTGPERAE